MAQQTTEIRSPFASAPRLRLRLPGGAAALHHSSPPISHNHRSMASSSKLSHAVSVRNTGAPALPPDALFEILLCLPAKELCRLRAVCRSWRALTYDPHFATVHRSRHAEPLFAFAFKFRDRDGNHHGVAIVDLSGQVLRRIPFGSDAIDLLPTHLDRLCVIRMRRLTSAAWVLNPATAVALALPVAFSDDWGSVLTVSYAFGQAASTGDYKVLRISHPDSPQSQLCDIITVDGSSSQGWWRRKQNPPSNLQRNKLNQIMECVAINGVLYFLFDYDGPMEPTSIAPFDLDTEKWVSTLQGPQPLRNARFGINSSPRRELSLVNLNGSLVIVDNDVGASFDLWFLVDYKRCLWVKKYRLSIQHHCCFARPLLILDDGRIVIVDMVSTLLQCYDPTTDSLADVFDTGAMGLELLQNIGVYTGSLLI